MKTVLAPNAPWPYNKSAVKKIRSTPAKNFEKWAAKQKVDWAKILGEKK